MLLRRVIQHMSEQNWTTILIEFVPPVLAAARGHRDVCHGQSGRPVSLRPPASHTTVRAVPHTAVQRARWSR
jgi:hypothetical protein